MESFAFIVGSPRSGTTILEDILELHPQVKTWYEPVFVIDRYFRDAPDDVRRATDATPRVIQHIQREFAGYARHFSGKLVIDKNPLNSHKLPLLLAAFPQAKYIHMLRDGRDVTLSIQREWDKRVEVLTHPDSHWAAVKTFKRYLDRQPLLRHKISAARFELGSPLDWVKGRRGLTYRAKRWGDHVGWGPQFEGWQQVIDHVPTLEFNARQWQGCVRAILEQHANFPPGSFLEVRYEDFVQRPLEVLGEIFSFLTLPLPADFANLIPPIKSTNFNKWETAFTAEEKATIGRAIQPLLVELGYAHDDQWYA